MVKKNRPSLHELSPTKDLKSNASHSNSKYSQSIAGQNRVGPKVAQKAKKGVMEFKRQAYDEPAQPFDNTPETPKKKEYVHHHTMDKLQMVHTSGKCQQFVRRLINKKWFRWTTLGLELIYFFLVLIYLFFVIDIEEDRSFELLIVMVIFLIL